MTFGAQDETVAFLSALDGGAERLRTTHISIVVLTKTRAYKLKRATALSYLDFSTPEKRLAMCAREVELNRRAAPSLYLGVRRITREADGRMALDGVGELIDAVVEMRRFDEAMLFSRLVADDRLAPETVERLAKKIAAFHDAAASDVLRGGAASMARILTQNETSVQNARPAGEAEMTALFSRLRADAAARRNLLDARGAAGKIRRCHGDLTLANIVLVDDVPTPFDCLEFSDELATIDILYDLAFTLMDLLRSGRADFSNLLLNRYLDARDETDGLPLLPLFMTLRATIRAHVAATQNRADEARDYFSLAQRLLAAPAARIIAIGGLSGSGKSSVARLVAPQIGAAPGARTLNSDRLRKALLGAEPTARLPQEAYASAVSQRVYETMFAGARKTAESGWPVIVDAVFDRAEDRAAIEAIAQEAGVPFHGVWLDAPLDRRAARVDARVGDVSDATRAVLEAQARRDVGEMRWSAIDASGALAEIAAAVLRAV